MRARSSIFRMVENAEEVALRVLRLADPGEFTPSRHLAARLLCSPSSVSKVIRRLVARGVPIERNAGDGGGYRLVRE